MFKLQKIKDTKLTLLIPIVLLCIVGGLTVFSTTYTDSGVSSMFQTHIVYYLIGFLIFFAITAFNPSKLKNKGFIFSLIIFSLISLVAVILIGTEIYGAQRWINLGFFSFQPSEFVKIAIILVTAFSLGVRTKKYTEELFNIYLQQDKSLNIVKIIKSEGFIKICIALLFYLTSIFLVLKQKSLGNTILITLIFLSILLLNLNLSFSTLLSVLPIIIGMLISFNIPDLKNINTLLGIPNTYNYVAAVIAYLILIVISKRFKLNILIVTVFFLIGLCVQPFASFCYNNVLEPYQRQRVSSFLGNEQSTNLFLNEDFNRQMSILAVGSGQVFGKGFLQGNIVNSRLLPFAYTDFAFAGFSEQFGFIGSVFIMILYLIILIKVYKVYLNTEDEFFKLICIGVISLIFFNAAQHIAMNMGITPITGVPLPLISYGGSSILTIFIGLGIVNSIDTNEDTDIEVESLKQDYGF